MRTYQDEDSALDATRALNIAASGGKPARPWMVVVDGPDEGQYTTMELDEAIDGGFGYTWDMR